MKGCLTALAIAVASTAIAQNDVLTQHNDNNRTGAVLNETVLTPASVASGLFGLLYTLPVDGQVYAQPLVVANYPFFGLTKSSRFSRDLLIVCTQHNTIYCFDTKLGAAPPIWTANMGPSIPAADTGSFDVQPEIGILSTPVVDRASGTVWLVAHTKETSGLGTPQYFEKLHALDLRTGKERTNSPVAIQGSVPGQAYDGTNGQVSFRPLMEMNRPGLLLDNGIIYISFASHGDNDPYHGWVFAYNSVAMSQAGIYCTTPDGDLNYYIPSGAGGIWMAGQGLACDDQHNVYFISGNGAYSADGSGRQTGNSFGKLKLGPGGLTLKDFFTPHDTDFMNWNDFDLGSSGALLVPGSNVLIGAGKTNDIFVLNRNAMGKFSFGGDSILQRFLGTAAGSFSSPVYWNGPLGPEIFTGGADDVIKQFPMHFNLLQTIPASASLSLAPWPGSLLSLSANGQSNAILWSLQPRGDGGSVLRAFDPNNLTREFWNSEMHAGDFAGLFAKFCPPTVANGKVFVPTFSNRVDVYGIPF